jgi:3-oxocholest-4-en-26-oate---CoA ligase
MGNWNFADVWEAVADVQPDATAQIHGDRRLTWGDMDRRADGIAQTLLDAGVAKQDKVAQYMYNVPEYLESIFGIWKAGLVPVNTNYRYADDELIYLWDNADAVAVVFEATFADRIERIRDRVPNVKTWIWVDDGSGPCPDWAIAYEEAVKRGNGRVNPSWGRSGDDLYMLYTGGTTGMPKGVMWRQDDIFTMLNGGNQGAYPVDGNTDDVRKMRKEAGPGPVGLPACPLMHGTGAFIAFNVLAQGGAVVTLTDRTFRAEELVEAVEANGVNVIALVGDAFAKPILRTLDAHTGKWDISSLAMMISSGVMWSQETKTGLLKHHSSMLLVDAFSSSEALGMGQSVSTGDNAAATAKFRLSDRAKVISEDGTRLLEPGSGEIGMLAVRGFTPIGYYKDPEKTDRTFKIIDGERYSIPGDFATIEADGTLTVLGRGSVCINTGGEKVFPEEVEEVLKTHPGVRDAVVVGVPDERFGEAITAMVEPHPDTTVDESDVIAHVKSKLSHFKAPKRVFVLDTVGRAANGKVDYKRMKDEAVSRVAAGIGS